MGAGSFCLMLGYCVVLKRVSWPALAQLAVDRCSKEENETSMLTEDDRNQQCTSETQSTLVANEVTMERTSVLTNGEATDPISMINVPATSRLRAVVRARFLLFFVFLLLASGALIGRLEYSPGDYCYPAPNWNNSTTCTRYILT